jgi:aryl-alcohol dehydrogenase-like predicted oxidoreductase
MAVLGLGLAGLGRPGYFALGHGAHLGSERSVESMERRCREVCDAAWQGGIRWFDAARSYGLAERFLAGWLTDRGIQPFDVMVSSKWGYTYTAGWRVNADPPEVKDHRVDALLRQWPESKSLLGPWLRLYQVHSATQESGVLDDDDVHRALVDLGVPVGVTLSGPWQAETLHQALEVMVDGRPLYSAVQATWNLLEPSAGPALADAKAAGWTVIVKEALANGRLVTPGDATLAPGDRPGVAALAAALAQPWADVVLSGAVTVDQLRSNLAAETVTDLDLDLEGLAHLAMDPHTYWLERAALPWT